MLVGFAFGALGMALSTFMRSWQDFDLMGSAQFALFLFSGTFVPAQGYPAVLRWIVEVTPLYRAVDLIRGITTGTGGWLRMVDVAYLLAAHRAGPAGRVPPDGPPAVQVSWPGGYPRLPVGHQAVTVAAARREGRHGLGPASRTSPDRRPRPSGDTARERSASRVRDVTPTGTTRTTGLSRRPGRGPTSPTGLPAPPGGRRCGARSSEFQRTTSPTGRRR